MITFFWYYKLLFKKYLNMFVYISKHADALLIVSLWNSRYVLKYYSVIIMAIKDHQLCNQTYQSVVRCHMIASFICLKWKHISYKIIIIALQCLFMFDICFLLNIFMQDSKIINDNIRWRGNDKYVQIW